MTNVKILRNFPISLDGITVQTWAAGTERDVSDAILAILISEGVCEIITKAMPAPPENKAIAGGATEKGGHNKPISQVSKRPPAPTPTKRSRK